MIEHCACGAYFKSRRYKRILEWRFTHLHPGIELEAVEPEREPDKSGAEAHTERASQFDYDKTRFSAKVGFPLTEPTGPPDDVYPKYFREPRA